MTKIVFQKQGEDFVRIECEGHTGYAEHGEDIVCAALSALVQGAVLGVLRVAGVKADYRIDEENGSLRLVIPKGIDDDAKHDCNVILKTLHESVKDLAKGYSEFIKVEVK